jgi:predicted kinase
MWVNRDSDFSSAGNVVPHFAVSTMALFMVLLWVVSMMIRELRSAGISMLAPGQNGRLSRKAYHSLKRQPRAKASLAAQPKVVKMLQIIVVSGPPGAGKTHLAESLGRDLDLPVIAKDDIKESLFDSLGFSDRDYSIRIGRAAFNLQFQLAKQLIANNISFILETAFYHSSSARLALLLTDVRVIQVWCTADIETLIERARTRPRHPGHAGLDAAIEHELRTKIKAGNYDPLVIDGALVTVNTNDFNSPEFSQAYQSVLTSYSSC